MSDMQDWQSEDDFVEDDGEISPAEMRYAPPTVSDEDEDGEISLDDVGALDEDAIEEAQPLTFEELSLAQVVGQFIRSPLKTWQALSRVTHSSRIDHSSLSINMPISVPAIPIPRQGSSGRQGQRRAASNVSLMHLLTTQLNPKSVQLILFGFAFLVVWFGNRLLIQETGMQRSEQNALVAGAPFLWIGFFLWIGAEIYGNWKEIQTWWGSRDDVLRIKYVLRIIPLFLFLMSLLVFVDSFMAEPEVSLSLAQTGVNRLFMGIGFWILIEVIFAFINRLYSRNSAMPDWMHQALEQRFANQPQISPVYYPSPALSSYFSLTRIIILIAASLTSFWTMAGTSNNHISAGTILIWIMSAVLWSFFFAPLAWNFFDWATEAVEKLRRFNLRANLWIIIVFVLIMLLAAGFRLARLDSLPSEMTSDHVEKLLDSVRTYRGDYNIFFANNGGREPLQMYLIALFSQFPGQGFNHYSLKLIAVIESLLTLPFLFWLGYEIFGTRNRRLGIIAGLLVSALVAVSYWDVVITRLGLRIILTPLVTAWLLIYLARAMRYNQRSDYIKAALVLGFGLYTYQAIRMLPVVIVVGIAIAILMKARTWREIGKYAFNLGVLVWISFMVFLPMFHYILDDPDHFLRRTTGRLLGDDIVEETLADGRVIERIPTPEERAEAFNANVPILMNNIRNAFLMFNWKGDVGWISGVPNEPAMDRYTATLLIVGLAAWISLMLRRRDPVIWLIPIMIFIMLLPSALSIAYPIENPSHTRTSGAIPPIYLMTAFPLALIVVKLMEILPKRSGKMIALGIASIIILLSNLSNTSLYFDVYPNLYTQSTFPYSQAGRVLRGFAESDGAYGNAFLIAYPYWWDDRAVGINAGQVDWENGVLTRDQIPSILNIALNRTDSLRLEADKDLLFFYHPDDEETTAQLRDWFPEGHETFHQTAAEGKSYLTYRVPALGETKLIEFVMTNSS